MPKAWWKRTVFMLPLLGCGAAEEPCPAARYCDQNTLVLCSDGEVLEIQETDCGELRCAVDAPVPQCVPKDALPCDPETATDECQDGKLWRCEVSAGYRLASACPEGELCVGTACQPAEDIPCDPGAWSPLCVDGTRFVCDEAQKVLVAHASSC